MDIDLASFIECITQCNNTLSYVLSHLEILAVVDVVRFLDLFGVQGHRYFVGHSIGLG